MSTFRMIEPFESQVEEDFPLALFRHSLWTHCRTQDH